MEYADSRVDLTAEIALLAEATASIAGSVDFSGPTTGTRLTRFVYVRPERTWSMQEGGELMYADGRVTARDFRLRRTDNRCTRKASTTCEANRTCASEPTTSSSRTCRCSSASRPETSGCGEPRRNAARTRFQPIIDARGEVSSSTIRGLRFHHLGAGELRGRAGRHRPDGGHARRGSPAWS